MRTGANFGSLRMVRERHPFGVGRMTIGIGLLCDKAIVLASDSQTELESNRKRFDLPKITLLHSAAPLLCGIIQAGRTRFATACVESIQRAFELERPKTAIDVRAIVTVAAKQMRQHVASLSPGVPFAHLDAHFELIVGVYDGNYSMFSIESTACLCAPENTGRFYIGTGDLLADYILDGVAVQRLHVFEAVCAALYAVEVIGGKTKECGGPTRVAMVREGEAVFFKDDQIARAAKTALTFQEESQKKWAVEITDWIEKQSAGGL